MPVSYQHIFLGYEIRDTLKHESGVAEWPNLQTLTIYIENTHDQDLTITIRGNKEKTTLGSVEIVSAFTVPANSQAFKTLTAAQTGWLPYIYVTAKATAAPTSGQLNVTALTIE
jgi:hypothetical protein